MRAAPRCRGCLAEAAAARLAAFTPQLRDKFLEATTVVIPEDDFETAYLCDHCEILLDQAHDFKTQCVAIDVQLKTHFINAKDCLDVDENADDPSNIKMEEFQTDNDTEEDDFYVIVVNEGDNDPDKSLDIDDGSNNSEYFGNIKNEIIPKKEYEITFNYNAVDETLTPDGITDELYDGTVISKDADVTFSDVDLRKSDFNALECDLSINNVTDSQNDKINIIQLFKDQESVASNDVIKLEDGVPIVDNVFTSEYVGAEDSVTYTQEEIVVANGEDAYEIINCDISELDMEGLDKTTGTKPIWQQEDGTFLCDCGLLFGDLLEYEKHVVVHNKFTCSACGKGFDSKEVYTGHMMLHDHNDTHLLCPFCMKNVKRHFFTSHITMNHSQFRPTCHICKKTFATEHNRKRHMLTHNCNNYYKCNACLSDFVTVEELKIHIDDGCENAPAEVTDPDNRKHVCNKCGKTYATTASLRSHVDFVHGAQRNELLCSECGLVLLTKKAMYAHSYVHKQNRPRAVKRFCCRVCGKACASQAMLMMHERVHTNERPYKCKKCVLAFKTKTHLNTHQLTHTQEKRFGCSVCLKFFALKGNLVVHLRTHTGERPYVCDICNQAFIDSKYLKKHKLRRHNSEFLYK